MADVTYIPDGNNQVNGILPWMLAAGNGGFGGFGGNGWLPGMLMGSGMGLGGFGGFGGGGLLTGGLGFILGLLFGNGWGGFGNGGGNGTGFISNQIDNNAGRELLMNAINAQGEASRAAVQNLATMTGQDFNLLNSDIEAVKTALGNLAIQQAVSVPQLINSIQAGNSDLALQLCKCCCEQRQLTVEQGYQNQLATINQTNTLGTAIAGSGQRTVDAIADLKTTMVKEFCDAKERDMQNEINRQGDIITQLRNQISNDKQTEAFTSAFSALNQKITDLAARQPNTVPVQWPALTAVNTTPYVNGGFYGNGNYFGPGFGWGNGISF